MKALCTLLLLLFVPLLGAKDIPVKIQSIEKDGEVFVHLPVLKSIDLITQYEGDGHIDLEEGVFEEAKVEAGEKEGDPSKLIIKRKGRPDVELTIELIRFSY